MNDLKDDFDDLVDLDMLADLLEGEEESSSSAESFKPKVETKKLISVNVDLFSSEKSNSIKEPATNQNEESLLHLGDKDSSDDDENKTYLTESGKLLKKRLALRKSYEQTRERKVIKTWKDDEKKLRQKNMLAPKESYFVEEFSGIRIVNPLVLPSMIKARMEGRRMIRMSVIKNFMRKGDIEGDWVTMGVLAHKVPPKMSKNGKTYSIWKMTDLRNTEVLVSVFLFGTVYAEHWKTSIGSVVGILNPSILPDREGKYSDISLSVDHAGKFMMLGTSKDFGHCKSTRKDGTPCTTIVNVAQCEHCTFHVSKEYKKMSGKRMELNSSFSGNQTTLKSKILKGQNIMYGGQMFSAPVGSTPSSSRTSKDKLRLNSLTLKRKAEEVENNERQNVQNNKKLCDLYGIETKKDIASKSSFINQQLQIPTAGSKNLFHHLVNVEKAEIAKKQIVSVTPKQLLQMHEQELKQRKHIKSNHIASKPTNELPSNSNSSSQQTLVQNSTPQIGRGLCAGDEISFDFKPVARNAINRQELAKMRAIKKIQSAGPLKQQNPNAIKSEKTLEAVTKMQLSLEKDLKAKSQDVTKTEERKEDAEVGVLGKLNMSAEKINQIMNRKSNHSFEIEMDEMERQEKYFSKLEKKEQMEEKMASTMEMVCDVVSCKLCRYTAHKANERCKQEDHPLKCHKALKRFFVCNNCKHRTYAFTKLPTRPCRHCGEINYERTSMMRPRSTKLDIEKLNIRGDEIKFLNSMK